MAEIVLAREANIRLECYGIENAFAAAEAEHRTEARERRWEELDGGIPRSVEDSSRFGAFFWDIGSIVDRSLFGN